MKIQKYLTKLIYILLILACMGIVWFVSRLADPPVPELLPETTEAELGGMEMEEATPSDAQEVETEAAVEADGSGLMIPEATKSWRPAGRYIPPLEEELTEEEEEPYVPPVLMLASDLHYYSAELTDGGAAFEKMIAEDDGKTAWYSDEMVDALLEEAVIQKPSALILAGDISSFGEKENHLRLAQKLKQAQAQGVQILVVPGNHDINSHQGYLYYGDKAIRAETVSDEEFVSIYEDFGYLQAIARDEHSLSYIYELDETHWVMMLDTCQYYPVNQVNGRLSPGTLEWIEEQLIEAAELGIQVLPVGHHNLLKESRLYITECTIENHDEMTALFKQYRTPIYISGHLHAQRVKQYQEAPGIIDEEGGLYEFVLTPYSIPECRYGLLWWDEEDGMYADTRMVSVSEWAQRHGSTDPNLLGFDELAPEWSRNIIKEQVKKTLLSFPEEQRETMAQLYAEVYYQYVKGLAMDRRQVERTESWKLWERMAPDNAYKKEITKMLDDCRDSHLEWNNLPLQFAGLPVNSNNLSQ